MPGTARVPIAACERVGFQAVGLDSGERVPGSCRQYVCPVCGPRKTIGYQQLAAGSMPERFVTLTKAPGSWQQLREEVKGFTRAVRQAGYRWRWYWVVEANPAGTGWHVHGLQHGDYVPQAFLQDAWGGRITHIQHIRVEVEAAKYVIKGAGLASAYLGKGAVGEGYYGHLDRNGWRCAHWSRGYMRIDGEQPATAAAMRLAWMGPKLERWVLSHPRETHAEVRARVAWAAQLQAEHWR